jgi:hypothetical protein
VTERNVSLLFNGGEDNTSYDAVLSIEERERERD